MALSEGVANSLSSKLNVNKGKIPATCGQLKAFKQEVQAKSGIFFPWQAEQLIDAVSQIQASLGCP
jgi:hypothetical protein